MSEVRSGSLPQIVAEPTIRGSEREGILMLK